MKIDSQNKHLEIHNILHRPNPITNSIDITANSLDLLTKHFYTLVDKNLSHEELELYVSTLLTEFNDKKNRDTLYNDSRFNNYKSWLEVPQPPPRDIVKGFTNVLISTTAKVSHNPQTQETQFTTYIPSFSQTQRILQRIGATIGILRVLLPLSIYRPKKFIHISKDLITAYRSHLFNRDWYTWQHPEVTQKHFISPLLHYCMEGWGKGWSPFPQIPTFPPYLLPLQQNPLILHYRLFGNKNPNSTTLNKLFKELSPSYYEQRKEEYLYAESKNPKIAVVIPIYNHPELLPPLVASLLEHTPKDIPIIFIENGSEDPRVRPALVQLAKSNPCRIQVECLDENIGFSGACNHGIKVAGARDVILLNNDTVVGVRWTDSLRLAAYARTDIGTATAVSNNSGLASIPNRGFNAMPAGLSVSTVSRGWLHAPETSFDLHTGHGFCLYLKREMLNEIGGFDAETFGKGYGEEADLCLRAWEKGWKHRVTTRAFVWHLNAVSFGGIFKAFKVHVARHTLVTLHPELDKLEDTYIPKWNAFSPWLQHIDTDIRRNATIPHPRVLIVSSNSIQEEQTLIESLQKEIEPFKLNLGDNNTISLVDYSSRATQEEGAAGAMLSTITYTDDNLISLILEYGIELILVNKESTLPAGLSKRLNLLHIPIITTTLISEKPIEQQAALLISRINNSLSYATNEKFEAPFASSQKNQNLNIPSEVLPGAFDPATFDRIDLSNIDTITINQLPLPPSDDNRLLLLSQLCNCRLEVNANTESPIFWTEKGMPHHSFLATVDKLIKPNRPPLDESFFPIFQKRYSPPKEDELNKRIKSYIDSKQQRKSSAKIIVYTAIAGGYEGLKLPEYPNPEVDYVYFAAKPFEKEGPWTYRPFAWEDEDPTRTARWHKLHGCDLFPNADAVIWIDGNVTLRSGTEQEIYQKLITGDNPIATLKHFDRNNVYDEVAACISRGKDDPALLRAQVARYRKEGLPDKHQFAETPILAFRANVDMVKKVFKTWWEELSIASRRDQISFPYAMWKNQMEFTPLFDKDIRLATDKVDFAVHTKITDPTPILHAKQYIIAPEPFNHKGFRHIHLPNGLILSYQASLRVRTTPDKKTILIGLAWSCEESIIDPLETIANCKTADNLESVLSTLSGRYIVIRDSQLYLDASGLLGCFYGKDCYSSSLALLTQHLKLKKKEPGLRHQFGGMDFYPSPLTPYTGILRLLPDQGINLNDCSVFDRLAEPQNTDFKTEEARISAIISAFDILLKRIADDYPNRIKLPLTAGYDSRTLAALLEHAQIDYETFTMVHRRLRCGDRDIPPKLAALVKKRHTLIPRPSYIDEIRLKAYDEHCAKMAVDEDRNFYAYHQYPEPLEAACRIAILRGGVWESVREYYREKHKIFKTAQDISEFTASFINVRYRTDLQAAFRKWIDHCKSKPVNYDSVDRYYRDQRGGAWLSSVEQSLDIIPGVDSIQPCNCQKIISLLRGFTREDRISCNHQVKIINTAAPVLLKEPFQGDGNFAYGNPNLPPRGLINSIKHKLSTIDTYLHCLGLVGTLHLLYDECKPKTK